MGVGHILTLSQAGPPGQRFCSGQRRTIIALAISLVAEGEDRRLDAVLQAELGEDGVDVGLDGLVADHRVPFTVAKGESLGIVCPSGSGKTTLLHIMGTLDRPSSGLVRITGLDIERPSDRELAALRATRIGFVFQQFFLAEHQSVLDNVPTA